MGTYSQESLVKLERILREQHDKKLVLRRAHRPVKGLHGPIKLGDRLKLPPAYIRRVVYEAGLDPFSDPIDNNTMRIAGHMVTHLGFSIKQASELVGLRPRSISGYLNRMGYTKFTVWGRPRIKRVYMPLKFSQDGWRVFHKGKSHDVQAAREFVGDEQSRDLIRHLRVKPKKYNHGADNGVQS